MADPATISGVVLGGAAAGCLNFAVYHRSDEHIFQSSTSKYLALASILLAGVFGYAAFKIYPDANAKNMEWSFLLSAAVVMIVLRVWRRSTKQVKRGEGT